MDSPLFGDVVGIRIRRAVIGWMWGCKMWLGELGKWKWRMALMTMRYEILGLAFEMVLGSLALFPLGVGDMCCSIGLGMIDEMETAYGQ